MKTSLLLLGVVLSMCVLSADATGSADQYLDALQLAIQRGIGRELDAMSQFVKIPLAAQHEIQKLIASQLTDRLSWRLSQMESGVRGSFEIVEDFVTSAVKQAAMRARQPPEQVRLVLESLAVEAQRKVDALLQRSMVSAGQKTTVNNNSNDSRMSALDLENIINDIIQTLLQDPAFISLIEWLATLPPLIHQIADELFANKTFQEIFAMFGLGSDVMSLQEMISDVPAESANTALYDSAMKMFQSALEDAQPHLRRISLIYNQMVNEQMYNLMQLFTAQREKVAFIDVQLFDEIKSAAIKILS